MSKRFVFAAAVLAVATTVTPTIAAAPIVNVRVFQFRPAQVQVAEWR